MISELLETHENHYKYELDLELIVYGRTYADKRVGPYARLLVFGPGEEILHEGDWGGNSFYILIDGRVDVQVTDEKGNTKKIGEVEIQNSFITPRLLTQVLKTNSSSQARGQAPAYPVRTAL